MHSRGMHRDPAGLDISFGRELLHLGSGAFGLHNIGSTSPYPGIVRGWGPIAICHDRTFALTSCHSLLMVGI